MSLSHNFFKQSSRHYGLISFANGIPVSGIAIFQWSGTSLVDHRLQRAVNIVFLTSSGHFSIMLYVSHFGDAAVFVDAMAMTVSNFSSVMSLAKISSISFQV